MRTTAPWNGRHAGCASWPEASLAALDCVAEHATPDLVFELKRDARTAHHRERSDEEGVAIGVTLSALVATRASWCLSEGVRNRSICAPLPSARAGHLTSRAAVEEGGHAVDCGGPALMHLGHQDRDAPRRPGRSDLIIAG